MARKTFGCAIDLIPNDGVIILDNGSTTLRIAKLLTMKKGLTIITNSLMIAQTLSCTENKVYLAGGEIRASSIAVVGFWALNAIRTVKADIAFLGTDGFMSHCGPSTASYVEAEVKQTILKSCQKSAVVCDSSKFRSDGMFEFGNWKDIDYLITDEDVPRDKAETLSHFLKVIIANH